nr:hypothetical protein [Tanacetum cinerariifolium]
MLKKYGLENSDAIDTSMAERSKLDEDPQGTPVDPTSYLSRAGSLTYHTSSRHDLVFDVCMCAWYPTKPTKKHLITVKRVFSYLKGTINMDANHVGCQDSRDSTSTSAQFLGEKLLTDYGFNYNKIPSYCYSKIAIALSCNIVQHSRTKHIAVRYHFIKEQVENEVVELYFVKIAYQLADIFTKALTQERFEFVINCLGMQSITPKELKSFAKSDEK